MSDPPKADPRTDEIWTYVGRRLGTDGVLYYAHDLPENEPDGKAPALFKKRITGGTIGGRYRVKVTREGENVRVTRDDYKYDGQGGTPELIRAWQAESASATAAYDAKQTEKKEGRSKLASMTLGELAKLYRRSPAPRQRALLAVVMAVITSRTAGEE